MNRNKTHQSSDLVNNTSFIRWVASSFEEDNDYWRAYLENHPGQHAEIENSVSLVRALMASEADVDPQRLEIIREKILSTSKHVRRKLYLRRAMAAAALALLLVGTYIVFYTGSTKTDYFENTRVTHSNEVQLVLSDGSVKAIDGIDSKIEQESDGTLVANSDTLQISSHNSKAAPSVAMNHLVVPFGKRTDLYLSDGSRIFVNAGSKLSFPSVFTGDKREIYLTGEAYCEVAADKDHPFIVHTPDVDIRVTGTAFNVQAYSNEDQNHTVLVHGEVTLIRQHGVLKSKMVVNPGEKVSYNKSNGNFSAEKVQTEQYTSWINGYLILQNRSVEYLFRSLERYYDTTIKCDGLIGDITFSGKLDLNDRIETVLETIGFASALEVRANEETFFICKKE